MIRQISIAVVAFTIASQSQAQAPDTTTLSAMVISATKTPASRVSLTQPVTVITGDELRSRGITRVSDALRAVPGAMLVQNGSTGSVNTLFMRGGESRYTKVLIDGVAVNAPGGFFDFSHLTVDNIERIEVVRGPASVVYGADAVSGIVQIFTRQGRGPFNGSAEARAGNRGSREVTLDANGSSGPLRYSIGGGARRTDGIFSFNNNYYNGTLSASAGLTPVKGSDLLVSGRYTDAEYHYPTDFTGAPVDSNSYRVQHRLTVGIDGKAELSDKVTGRARVGTNEVSDLTEDIFQPFDIGGTGGILPQRHSALMSRNKRRSADGGFAFKLKQGVINIGAEYLNESERSVNSEGPVGGATQPTSTFDADRHNTALYSEIVATSDAGSSWTVSARRDDNSMYDPFTSYRAGVSLPAGQASRLRASMSTSFNAPAFNQIEPTLYTKASPDLKPERARSWEIGAEQTLAYGILKVSASYFNQRFRDLIQYVNGSAPDYLGSYANLTEAESNGYEGEVTLTPVNEWTASASYTFAEPRVKRISSDYAGELQPGDPLLRRPKHSGTATLTWSKPRVASLSLLGSYVGDRPDMDFNKFPSEPVTLPAYTKIDIAGSFSLIRTGSKKSGIDLTVRVDNALDRKYEDVFGYPAPKRTWLVGARIEGAM